MIELTVVVFASDWDNPFSNNEMYAVFPGRLITNAQVRGPAIEKGSGVFDRRHVFSG